MNNEQPLLSTDANRMTRARILYLTSEQVADFTDASSANYSLHDPIRAEEGFNIAYGVRSFGYTASAHNISLRQRNDSLLIKIYYKQPLYIRSLLGELGPKYSYIPNPNAETIKTYEDRIYINDGLYNTLDKLFQELSSILNYFIISDIQYDINAQKDLNEQDMNNPTDVPFYFDFTQTNGGYTIEPKIGTVDQEIINNYPMLNNAGKSLQAYQVNVRLQKIEILRDPDNPGLYDLLFTNDSHTENHPPQVPKFINKPNLSNPPTSIVFLVLVYMGWNKIDGPSDTADISNFVRVDQDFLYKAYGAPDVNINTDINNTIGTIPSVMFNYPFVSFFKPRITPLYIDIKTNIETNNLTDQGVSSGLLLRHFVLGGEAGAVDFYQSWDSPVITTTLRSTIESIILKFEAEGDKWSFFNMNFFLEIVFFEYPEATEIATYVNQNFDIPTDDPLTAQLDTLLGPVNNQHKAFARTPKRGKLVISNKRRKGE